MKFSKCRMKFFRYLRKKFHLLRCKECVSDGSSITVYLFRNRVWNVFQNCWRRNENESRVLVHVMIICFTGNILFWYYSNIVITRSKTYNVQWQNKTVSSVGTSFIFIIKQTYFSTKSGFWLYGDFCNQTPMIGHFGPWRFDNVYSYSGIQTLDPAGIEMQRIKLKRKCFSLNQIYRVQVFHIDV